MKSIKKMLIGAHLCAGMLVQVINPCLNTIRNNTAQTYKVAEIKQENLFLKSVIDLPEDYLNDEQKAHTLKPGESVSFGGHYLPTFAIFKEYNSIWECILVVKQRECGPRGKEEKTLLLTDLLKGELPGDFQPSYKFSFKRPPQTIIETSVNKNMLESNKNIYQLVSEESAKFEQRIQEIISQQMQKEKEIERVCPAASDILNGQQPANTAKATPTPQTEDMHQSKTVINSPSSSITPMLLQQQNTSTTIPSNEDEDDDGKPCAKCAAA